MKVCTKCGVNKKNKEFYKRNMVKSGLVSACKECLSKRNKIHYQENKEHLKKVRRDYYNKTKEVGREKSKKYYIKNKNKIKCSELRRNFNITLEDYNNILKRQKNRCAICGIDKCKTGRNFAVDHCHKTGNVRGLLCALCNTGIGKLNDDIKLLKKAIKYLEKAKNAKKK